MGGYSALGHGGVTTSTRRNGGGDGRKKRSARTGKAKARSSGCGCGYHNCGAFDCASRHPPLPTTRPRPTVFTAGYSMHTTKGSRMHPMRYACTVQIGELPGSGAGVLFTRQERGVCLPEKGVTFLHFVRLGRFCSTRPDPGTFSCVGQWRGRGWWLMRDMPLARKWIRSRVVTPGDLRSGSWGRRY